MSAALSTSAPAGTTKNVQAESLEPELKDMGNGQEMTDVTLVPREVSQLSPPSLEIRLTRKKSVEPAG